MKEINNTKSTSTCYNEMASGTEVLKLLTWIMSIIIKSSNSKKKGGGTSRRKRSNNIKLILSIPKPKDFTLFAFGANVALECVHLDLNAFVFTLGLGRFSAVDEQNGDRDEDKQNSSGRDATNGFRWECVRLDYLILQVADWETDILANANDN